MWHALTGVAVRLLEGTADEGIVWRGRDDVGKNFNGATWRCRSNTMPSEGCLNCVCEALASRPAYRRVCVCVCGVGCVTAVVGVLTATSFSAHQTRFLQYYSHVEHMVRYRVGSCMPKPNGMTMNPVAGSKLISEVASEAGRPVIGRAACTVRQRGPSTRHHPDLCSAMRDGTVTAMTAIRGCSRSSYRQPARHGIGRRASETQAKVQDGLGGHG